ncbi:hypothetical protein [Nocardia nova]|uniref:hypothetical protein n=1 Tax=Nocardia nova TaxID=37330 RepID=UPI0033FB1482
MNQTAHEFPGRPIAKIVDEWWIPAGRWVEVAVYDAVRAANLLYAANREAAARAEHLRTTDTTAEGMAPLAVCIDDMEFLAGQWHRLLDEGDRHHRRQLAAADPNATLRSLIAHAPQVGITVLFSVPTAPVPRPIRELLDTRVNPSALLQDAAPLPWETFIGDRGATTAATRLNPPPRRDAAAQEDVVPASRLVQVWRTPAAPTRTLLAYPLPDSGQPALYSAELSDFVEDL